MRWEGRSFSPSQLRRSASLDRRPPACRGCQLGICLPSIATSVAGGEIKGFAFITPVTMFSAGEFSWVGETVADSFGLADWLRAARRITRRAADRSFGSSLRPGLTSTANRIDPPTETG